MTVAQRMHPGLIRDENGLRSAVAALLSARRDVRAVAAETGLSKTTVSELRGRRRAISQDALRKVAGRYDPVRAQAWEEAWRRVYGEHTGTRLGPPAPPTPRELPLDIGGFSGRGPELAALDRAADRGGGVVAITGTAGVGKTTLAVHWAHRVQHRYADGSLYVDLHGYDEQDPASAASVIAAVAGRLGHDRPNLPTDLDVLAALYRTILTGRRILLILDNAHSTEQVLPLLPGTFDGTAVITSRDDLAVLRSRFGIRRLALDTLPMDEAVDLIRFQLPVSDDPATPATLATLAESCARLPLALRVAAGLLADSPGVAAGELAELLTAARADDAPDVAEVGEHFRSTLDAVFASSYRHLEPAVARSFRLLSLHPTGAFTVSALAALTGADGRTAGGLTRKLTRSGLAQDLGDGRYSLHDLLRRYAADRSAEQDTTEDRHEAVARLLDHYLAAMTHAAEALAAADSTPAGTGTTPTGPDAREALAWLDAERPTLVRCVVQATDNDLPEAAVGLATTLWRYLHRGGHHLEAAVVHAHAASAAHGLDDPNEEATALDRLAIAQEMLGQYEDALRAVGDAMRISIRAGDRSAEAAALGHLGTLHARREHNAEALSYLDRQLTIARMIGDRGQTNRAINNIGLVLLRWSRYPEAIVQLRQAVAEARELGMKNFECIALNNLGLALQRTGSTDAAMEALTEALAIARNQANRAVEAQVHDSIGVTLARCGDTRTAIGSLERALDLHRQHDDRAAEAETLDNLGNVLNQVGRDDEALAHHQQALLIAEELGERGRSASAYAGRAAAHKALVHPDLARRDYDEALRISLDIGNIDLQARATDGLAQLSRASRDQDSADKLSAEARQLWARIGVPEDIAD